MSRLRRILLPALALAAASLALAVPAQQANAAGPVNRIMVWGDSMTQVWPGYLDMLLPIPVIPMGTGADNIQQTKARFTAWADAASPTEVATTAHICWCGHTNVNRANNTPQLIVPTLQAMASYDPPGAAARVPVGRFMAIGLTGSPLFPKGSPTYDLTVHDTTAPFAQSINEQIAVAFGRLYVDMRGYMIESGLARAGLRPSAEDQANIDADVPPRSMRTDVPSANDAHLNDAGRWVVAQRLAEQARSVAVGWLAPETRPTTVTSVTSSSNPSTPGSPVQMTAIVSAQAGTPSGTVQFRVDGKISGPPIQLQRGRAVSQPVPNLAEGPHTVTGFYAGSASFAASVSALRQIVGTPVTVRSTATAVTSSMNPVPRQTFVRFTATVTNTSGQAGPPTPTGTVQFYKNGVALGGARPVSAQGVAVAQQVKFPVGSYQITAVYSGDAYYLASTSPTITQVVT